MLVENEGGSRPSPAFECVAGGFEILSDSMGVGNIFGGDDLNDSFASVVREAEAVEGVSPDSRKN